MGSTPPSDYAFGGNYPMKIVIKILAFLLLIIYFNPSLAECIEKSRQEKWPVVENAFAIIGDKKLEVYYDPENPSHILIYPECWLIRRDAKVVVMPNCTFELVGEKLYFDKTWRDSRGYVTGVEWGDPKMDNISFFSTLFRKPKFKSNSVSIWDGDKWIHVDGLPDIAEDRK